jgi:hypothetical protein
LRTKINFVIKYKEGWRNTKADTISRTHAVASVCVITRSGRRTAEDNSVPMKMKMKRRNKIRQTRTTERFRVERS